MKITLDIPDSTVCAFFDFVYYRSGESHMSMQGHSMDSDDLYDGAEIRITPVETKFKPTFGSDIN